MRLTKMCAYRQNDYLDHAQLLTHVTIQRAGEESLSDG